MSQLPLISVIVPVYKVEPYLNKCLESITGQTYRNLEIILVDDGSPDRSGAICDEWAARDSRVRVIHKTNAGAGAARNTALDEVRGEFVGMVDSDDYIEPHMYAHLLSLMGENVDIAECTITEVFDDAYVLDDGSSYEAKEYTAEEAMLLHIRNELFRQTPPNKLYRSHTVKDVRFPEGTLIDDEFWTYRVIGNARKLVQSSCCMYAYRQQQSSAMHKPYSVRRLDGLKAKVQRWQYLKEKMPALAYEAQVDLLMSCLYGAQGSLECLHGQELESAREILENTMGQITPVPVSGDFPLKRRIIMKCVQRSLEGTARVLNFLIRVHILT